MASPATRERFTPRLVAAITAASLFILLRLAGLLQNNELDDQDSIGYLKVAAIFRSLDFQAIVDLTPTALPLYSMTVAAFSIFTGDYEVAARLASLTASAATAFAIYLLAKRLWGPWAGVVAVMLLAVNPYHIRFSYSILSEPLYGAIYAWTLYVFIAQIRAPDVRSWLVLGALGGLAFASRFESILLFAALPFLQLAFLMLMRTGSSKSELGKAALVYCCTFTILLAPQVWRVSEKMNSFALNGRTAWQTILSADDGKSFHEKLYGLDYHPAMTNLVYLLQDPEARNALAHSRPLVSAIPRQAKKMVVNLERIHVELIPRLIGIPVFAFATIGLLVMLRSARVPEALGLLGLLGIGLAAPLAYRVELDHIALVAPPLIMLAGIGVCDSIRSLVGALARTSFHRLLIAAALVAAAAAPYSLDLFRLYTKADDPNRFYDPAAIHGPVTALRQAISGSGTAAKVAGANSFVAYYAGGDGVPVPFTDLEGLVGYMEANEIQFIYVNKYLEKHPFVASIGTPEWDRAFSLRYEGQNESEGTHKLYALE